MLAIDFVEGVASLWRWYAGVVVLFAAISLSLVLRSASLGIDVSDLSFGDYLLCYFAGSKQCHPFGGEPFSFPVSWALVFLYVLYLTLWYPYRDLAGFGRVLITAGGGRWRWWLAKCAWVVLSTLLFFTLAVVVAALSATVFGGKMSMGISNEMPCILDLRASQLSDPPYQVEGALGVLVFATISLSLFQLACSLAFGPIASYVASLAVLFVSAFYFNSALIGNYMMIARSASMMAGGVSELGGMLVALVLSCASIAVGGMAFSRMDIIDRERLR